jgi:hypothetical protein
MSMHWVAIDRLIRELRSLRAAAIALEQARTDADVTTKVQSLVAAATAAVEATTQAPTDGDLIMEACEAIVRARSTIETYQGRGYAFRDPIQTSIELRRQATKLWYEIALSRRAKEPRD